MKGNYYDIAVSDLYFAKIGIDAELDADIGGYNNCAASCTQATEKLLKYLFVTFDLPFEPRLSESHNLNALLRELIKTFPALKELTTQCRFLNDFYIEVRYPGDSFEWIDGDTAKLCYEYTMEIKQEVDSIIQNPSNQEKLKELLVKKFNK